MKALHVRIDEELHKWLKLQSVNEGKLMQELVEEALRLLRAEREQK